MFKKRNNDKPASGFRSSRDSNYGSSRSSSNESGFGSNRRFGRRPARKKLVKKFDPSVFVKKVEETVAAPIYVPVNKFADFKVVEQIKKNISDRGYVNPTPIQDKAIPSLLLGKDVIASANTGTGKTAAFLIPLIHRVVSKEISRVLIIVPTRELASQIQAEFNIFRFKTNLNSALCIGGMSVGMQIRSLSKDPAFVIGTPGRLIDLESSNSIDFKAFDAIVLDEVDTMFDMGFITDIKYIIGKLPENRQSLFFSATIPPKIKDVMDKFLRNPEIINVRTRQSAENVNQDVINVEAEQKDDVLHDLLIKPEFKKVIIFSRTKRATDKLSRTLRDRGFRVAAIHGDRTQEQRRKALELFKFDRVNILLATDVVARGIDIEDVSHVINFDLPQTHEDYIHRIGRTGRANKVGQAITFVDKN